MMGIRIAHFSDLHYGHRTMEEADRCFSFAVDEAMRRNTDVAVVSGDTTDHALETHAPALKALATHLRRLLDHCPILLLQGTFSHEPAGALSLFRLMGGNYPIFVADRLQQVALTSDRLWVPSSAWRFDRVPANATLLCSCVPTLNKAALAAVVGAVEAGEDMGRHLEAVLAGFSVSNTWAGDHGIPSIGVGHGTVRDCETEHGVPMAGLDHEFTAAGLFEARASAFMLGHIHLHQSWRRDRRVIAYPGSIGCYHFGERGTKGFLLWDVAADGATFEHIATPARQMTEFNYAGLPDMAELEAWATAHDLAASWIRVRFTYLEEERACVDRTRIETIFRSAANLKLEGRMVPLTRSRAAGINACLSLESKVDAWAKVVDADGAPLIACLERLQASNPEEIAAGILTLTDRVHPFGADAGAQVAPMTSLHASAEQEHGTAWIDNRSDAFARACSQLTSVEPLPNQPTHGATDATHFSHANGI